MSNTKGRTVDGLTFPALRVSVQDITDWRWYAGQQENGQLKLVRRLGDRTAEIHWDGKYWRWEILGEKQAVLMRGQGGRLTEALVEAETAQPYQNSPCPAWCSIDHNTDSVHDSSRFHWTCDEIPVSKGMRSATVGSCYVGSPDSEERYGPVVHVGGLDDCDMTAAEAQRLLAALTQAIEHAKDAGSLRDHDVEQHRQSVVRQRTSIDMRAYALPLAGEDVDWQAA